MTLTSTAAITTVRTNPKTALRKSVPLTSFSVETVNVSTLASFATETRTVKMAATRLTAIPSAFLVGSSTANQTGAFRFSSCATELRIAATEAMKKIAVSCKGKEVFLVSPGIL